MPIPTYPRPNTKDTDEIRPPKILRNVITVSRVNEALGSIKVTMMILPGTTKIMYIANMKMKAVKMMGVTCIPLVCNKVNSWYSF